jgi:small subunit ribosomal protein S11
MAKAKSAAASAKAKAKKRNVKIESEGQVHIKATFNNIIVSLTNRQGQVISWGSAGKAGFRGSKKNTPYAAQIAAQDAAKVAYEAGMRAAIVYVKGPGSGRESAIRAVNGAGIIISEIHDITPIPHNGCRPPKRRRV